LAQTWIKLAAEFESDQALLNALSEINVDEPFYAVPEALNLRADRRVFSQAGKPGASSVSDARRAEMFGKGGVHVVGTTIFTVIALRRRASGSNIYFS
jgi:hypothetical protein